MTYIGQQPATTFDSGIQDRFTGLSTNTVTLTHEISAEEDILVVWNNIVQDKNTYSVGGTGNKTLTLGGTLVSADVVTVYYLNKVMQSVNPTAGSVNTDQLASSAVTDAKIADVAASKLTGTIATARLGSGTASSSTFLRGDNAWASAGGDNTPYFVAYRSGNQTGVSSNTWTDIIHNAEDVDSASAYDTSTGRFTPQTAGYYQINCTAMGRDFGGDSTSDVAQLMVAIFKNTETDPRSTNFLTLNDPEINRFVTTVSTVIQLNGSSDYVVSKIYIVGASGSVHGERQYTNFSGFKLIT